MNGRCQTPGKPCERLATVMYHGKHLCDICMRTYRDMGLDPRPPIRSIVYRPPLGGAA